MGLVAGVEGFVGEQENAVAQMGVEVAGQVLGVGDGEAVLAKQIFQGACQDAFAGAFDRRAARRRPRLVFRGAARGPPSSPSGMSKCASLPLQIVGLDVLLEQRPRAGLGLDAEALATG